MQQQADISFKNAVIVIEGNCINIIRFGFKGDAIRTLQEKLQNMKQNIDGNRDENPRIRNMQSIYNKI